MPLRRYAIDAFDAAFRRHFARATPLYADAFEALFCLIEGCFVIRHAAAADAATLRAVTLRHDIAFASAAIIDDACAAFSLRPPTIFDAATPLAPSHIAAAVVIASLADVSPIMRSASTRDARGAPLDADAYMLMLTIYLIFARYAMLLRAPLLSRSPLR